MNRTNWIEVCGIMLALLLSMADVHAASPNEAGEVIYRQRCAPCHDHPREQIPAKAVLATKARSHIIEVLTVGPMKPQAAGLSTTQISAVAGYLTSLPASQVDAGPSAQANLCKPTAAGFGPRPGDWNGWSPDLDNSRQQKLPGLSAADIPRLRPKWVFAYPGNAANGPPSVIGGRVFLGTDTGIVLSLDAKSGCTHWATKPGLFVKSAVSVGALPPQSGISEPAYAAFFSGKQATVYAVNALTGAPIWNTRVDPHPFAAIGESPKLYENRLYVPIRSSESEMGARGEYGCCTLRGGLAALDAVTGGLLWRTYTIIEEPKPFKVNRAGTQMYGPAGAGIWSPATIDPKSGVVYGTSSESRTEVATDGADAMMAFDMKSGVRRWVMQATANDNWVWGCEGPASGANCPQPLGPDADFASPAILRTLPDGKRVLIGAQKSGMVHALDPDRGGTVIWRRDLAADAHTPAGTLLRDREQPGVVFGMAADTDKLYVAIADPDKTPGHIPLGVYSLWLANGKIAWHTPGAPVPSCDWGAENCTGAQRTAVTVIPGAAFAGSTNGHVRAYASNSGEVIWDFDTAVTFRAVNGVTAHGGSVEGSAVVVADGTVFVMSGYAGSGGGSGNVLIAFTVDGK